MIDLKAVRATGHLAILSETGALLRVERVDVGGIGAREIRTTGGRYSQKTGASIPAGVTRARAATAVEVEIDTLRAQRERAEKALRSAKGSEECYREDAERARKEAARREKRAAEFAAEQAAPRADLARIDARLAELTGGAS